jgi:hypothetical protein
MQVYEILDSLALDNLDFRFGFLFENYRLGYIPFIKVTVLIYEVLFRISSSIVDVNAPFF